MPQGAPTRAATPAAAPAAMPPAMPAMAAKPDDQLGYYQANYTNLFDNLGIGPHPSDRPSLAVDKIRLGYRVDVA